MMTGADPRYSGLYKSIVGVALGVLGILCFAVGGVTVQALDRLIPVFELNFIRIAGK